MNKKTKKFILTFAVILVALGTGLTIRLTRATGNSYTITYVANDANIPCTAAGIPSSTTANEGSTVTIPSTIPTCDGYMFHSWEITTSDVVIFNDTNFRMPAKNVTITATWGKATLTKSIGGEAQVIPTMQNFTCSSLQDEQTATLIDSREGGINSYIVGKADDGECWMLQNLRLGSSLDLGNGTLNINKVTTSGVAQGTFALTGRVEDSLSHDGSGNNDSSQFVCDDDYGCYYNWYAATAGSGTSSVRSGDATYSICPDGWALPSQTQWDNLIDAYVDDDSLMMTGNIYNENGDIPGIQASGLYGTGTRYWGGQRGYYWSRSVPTFDNGSIYSPMFDFDSDSHDYISTSARFWGLSVRCISVH